MVAINDRSYDQSWPSPVDRTINRGILHEKSIGGATGRKVARPVARLIVRPFTNRECALGLSGRRRGGSRLPGRHSSQFIGREVMMLSTYYCAREAFCAIM